jgi:hypothetical protein
MFIANAHHTRFKLRQERHVAVHAPPHMPLLTELDGFAVGDVAINMPLLAELDGIPLGDAAINMALLAELSLDAEKVSRRSKLAQLPSNRL